jgi:hypothetical protein
MAATPLLAATNDLTSRLQQGLFEEEANRNLDAAIANYQLLAAQFDKNRQIAATAIFRLGECYRKLGKTNEAVVQYQRILRDFSDQQTLVTLSQQNLTGLGIVTTAAATPAISKAAQEEQKRLLEEEIKLIEKQLVVQQKLVEVGKLAPDELLPMQRDLLHLRQQMAALDAGQPLPNISAQATLTTDDEDQEIRRNQAMMQNSPDLINSPNGNHPLIRAADAGWLKVAAFLLDHGADVNAAAGGERPNPFGRTALHHAAAFGNKAMVELLLSRGAEVNAKGDDGRTPLYLATERGFQAIVEVLLANKADVNVSDKNTGITPLHLAAESGRVKIIQLLLAAGANPNAENNQGRTPFHGADPNVRNNNGQTPLDVIKDKMAQSNIDSGARASLTEIAALLRSHGALDHLPHWDRITNSRPSADFSRTVFREGTNDWNRFTLLETILNYYELQKMNSIPFGSVPGAGDSAIATMAFPDLARVVIARYTPGTTNETRIKINLLNSTNGIDCSKDVPLEFGDVVEIPEREHTLAESDENTPAVRKAILDFLRSKAGSVRLIIAGGQTIQVPLDDFEPDRCYLGNVLQSPQAQNVLTTDSDFSRVKVTHRDPATGRKREWILHVSHWHPASNQIVVIPQRFGMSNPQSAPEPNLWLRDGDVIEVPEK